MNCAARLGVGLSVTPPETVALIQKILKKFDMPLDIPCPWDTMIRAVGLDKKRTGDSIHLIVLEELGRAARRKMPRDELLGLLEPMYGR